MAAACPAHALCEPISRIVWPSQRELRKGDLKPATELCKYLRIFDAFYDGGAVAKQPPTCGNNAQELRSVLKPGPANYADRWMIASKSLQGGEQSVFCDP